MDSGKQDAFGIILLSFNVLQGIEIVKVNVCSSGVIGVLRRRNPY
jgi:hypothetical protein